MRLKLKLQLTPNDRSFLDAYINRLDVAVPKLREQYGLTRYRAEKVIEPAGVVRCSLGGGKVGLKSAKDALGGNRVDGIGLQPFALLWLPS